MCALILVMLAAFLVTRTCVYRKKACKADFKGTILYAKLDHFSSLMTVGDCPHGVRLYLGFIID